MTVPPELLRRLIDYAGMFPPAALDVDSAIDEYRRLVASPHRAVVGPLLVRATDLHHVPPEFETGVVADRGLADAMHRVGERAMPVVQIEARLPDAPPAELAAAIGSLPNGAQRCPVFLEVSTAAVAVGVGVVAEIRSVVGSELPVIAKLRTGGEPNGPPAVGVVADFIEECARHALPFKATAGLHHALFDGVNHGFLNVLAATFVSTGDARQQVLRELRATTLDGLSLPRSASDAARVRRAFVSLGSCSVDEPVDDLTALRMLG
jgi:hypothetical protein